MRKLVLTAALGATLLGGAAVAQQQGSPAPHPSRATPWQNADTNRDGVVTRDEAVGSIDAQFARMDRDGNGTLTAEELRPRHRGAGTAPKHEHGTAPDATAAGQASDAERAGRRAARMQKLDRDGDGTVSAQERTAARGERGPRRGKHGMLARADANGDGTVTRDEFRAASIGRFDRADANRDGRLDASEQQAMMAKASARADRLRQRADTAAAVPADR